MCTSNTRIGCGGVPGSVTQWLPQWQSQTYVAMATHVCFLAGTRRTRVYHRVVCVFLLAPAELFAGIHSF